VNVPAIVGAGMTHFGKHLETSLAALAGQAVDAALADAGLERGDIDMAFVANAMASITTGQVSVVGQSVLRPNGFAGIPVFNVDNACASSSSALTLALHAIAAGAARTVLVLGVEKLYASDRTASYRALNGASDTDTLAASGVDAGRESVFVTSVYPARIAEYSRHRPLEPRVLAEIAVKNRGHAALNPYAQYTAPLTVEDVLASRTVVAPVTALMCAPIGDGAAAVIVTAADPRDSRRPVWVRGSAVGMGAGSTAGGMGTVGRVARQAYAQAGITPADVDVAEVHDSIAFNELLAYEELGLCSEGDGAAFALSGATTLGGRTPVNPSGGLESRGHPVAATGLAQVTELVTQLRGEAGGRQVPGARVAVAENAGGYVQDDTAAVAVTVLTGTAAS
jgi:acetyl-CoA acyltransferase